MRLAAASRPRVGGIGNGLRVSALARPSSPQSLSAKRAAAAPPSRAPPSWKKKSDDERHASSRGPISAAASSSSSSAAKASSSSSSGDDDEACDVYVTPEGEVVEIMCGDYGFRSGFGRLYQGGDGEIPAAAWELGWTNFKKELKALRESVRFGAPGPRAAPPKTALGMAAASAVRALSEAAFAADVRLEAAGALPKLEAPATEDRAVAADDDAVVVGNASSSSSSSSASSSSGGATSASAAGKNDEKKKITRSVAAVRQKLAALTLDDAAVWRREKARERSPAHYKAPLPVRALYLSLCVVLDLLYAGRPIQRFWVLETVARMPYFAYISMLHLYESLGWWRAGAELRRVHFAEEWNELHHLQIMESLGGDARWADRALAAHASLFYYWGMVLSYVLSPPLAYAFSELVEGHATDTYTQFVEENEEALKSMAAPRVALEYYKAGDLFYFDELVTAADGERRRPEVRNLYDVFAAIRDDEQEHIRTMRSCRDSTIVGDLAARRAESKRSAAGGAAGAGTTASNSVGGGAKLGGGNGNGNGSGLKAGLDGSAVSSSSSGSGNGSSSSSSSAAPARVEEEVESGV